MGSLGALRALWFVVPTAIGRPWFWLLTVLVRKLVSPDGESSSGRTLLGEAKRAGDGIRTHDNDVGNVVLYQLSYTRLHNPPPASRDRPTSLGSTDYRGTPWFDKVI